MKTKRIFSFCMSFIMFMSVFFVLQGCVQKTEVGDVVSTDVTRNENGDYTNNSPVEDFDFDTEEYENGDYTYQSTVDDIAFDAEEKTLYYNNLISVYLNDELSESECESIADSVGGKLCSYISGAINMFEIKTPESDLENLKTLAKLLSSDPRILTAAPDIPLEMTSLTDNNPWNHDGQGTISDKNNNVPGGNDWWAEAIDAYTAWEEYDSRTDIRAIPAGVIDSGFNTNHEELSGKLIFPPKFSANEASDHGTMVSGFIVAKNNDKGIRGIADKSTLYCISHAANDNYFSNSSVFIEANKQLVESGVCAINNSYANTLNCQTVWANENLGKYNFLLNKENYDKYSTQGYGDYLTMMQNISEATGKICILLIYNLLKNGYEDFIFVQGAGNGYNNYWGDFTNEFKTEGHDSKISGYYNAITRELFNSFDRELNNKFSDLGYDYNTINDHKICVGAVRNELNEDGRYLAALGSSYGDNVDIFAPGDNLFGLGFSDNDSGNNSFYDEDINGTSAAAPMVTGSLTLLWSLFPDTSAGDLKNILCTSETKAVGVGADEGHVYPMLNVGLAVNRLKFLNSSPSELIEADEDDFYLFTDTFTEYACFSRTITKSFNCETASTEDVIDILYDGGECCSFNKVDGVTIVNRDPLDRMAEFAGEGTIFKVSCSTLEHICEDVFNVTFVSPENSEFQSESTHYWKYYTYNGYMYFWGGPNGKVWEDKIELNSYSRLDDGKYLLNATLITTWPDETERKNFNVTAGLKVNQGERYWSIYSVEPVM